MKQTLFTVPLIILCAACSVQRTDLPTHEACAVGKPYSGKPLRKSVEMASVDFAIQSKSDLSADETTGLEAAFDRAQSATDAPSLSAAVWQAGGAPWSRTYGTPEGHVHYWASVGKIITASAILKLMEQGRLSLDDPISRYIDHVPNGDIISLRMLLNHTSGLFSANEDPKTRARGTRLDLDSVLEIINRQPPYACPGQAWRYSNSGYILLGAVIEKITGKPYHLAAYNLVLKQSAGGKIRVLGPKSSFKDVVLPVVPANETAEDIREPRGAGVAVASAENMALFMRDLLGGRILDEATLDLMLEDPFPMFDEGLWYGLGLMVFDVPTDLGTELWIGHSGGAPGARAILVYSPEKDAIVAVALTGEGSVEATANLMLRALE